MLSYIFYSISSFQSVSNEIRIDVTMWTIIPEFLQDREPFHTIGPHEVQNTNIYNIIYHRFKFSTCLII